MHHDLNIDESFFAAVQDGRKTFEIRFNDRGFQAGDTITLREVRHSTYTTGRRIGAKITYVLGFNQQPNWVVFAFEKDTEL